jgi:hypothetical protein
LKLTYNVLEFQTIQSGKETSLLFHLVESKYPALSVIFLLLISLAKRTNHQKLV